MRSALGQAEAGWGPGLLPSACRAEPGCLFPPSSFQAAGHGPLGPQLPLTLALASPQGKMQLWVFFLVLLTLGSESYCSPDSLALR